MSNCAIVEYRNDSASFAFNFVPPAQSILGITVSSGSRVTLTYATTPGFPYHVERATGLSPPTWLPISSSATNAAGSSVAFADPNPLSTGPIYYRTASP